MRFQTSLMLSMALVACSEDKGGGDPVVDAAPADAAPQDAAPQPMDAAPQPMDAAPEPMDAAPESMDAAPPVGCEDLSGMYIWDAPCTEAAGTEFEQGVILWACLSQTECTLSDPTVSAVVVGDEASLEVDLFGGTCGIRFADGASELTCDVPHPDGPEGNRVMCGGAQQQRITEPGAVSYCCDVVQQDCGAGLRCQVFNASADGSIRMTACIPLPAEPIAEDAPCTRVDGRVGADTCEAGTFCANFDQPTPGDRVCASYCQSETDCAAGEVCSFFGDTPYVGVCRSTCTIGGVDCADGLTCRSGLTLDSQEGPYTIRPMCIWFTDGPVVGECSVGEECGANDTCATRDGIEYACRATCDATHGCEPGFSCTPFDGVNPQGIGACYADE